MLFSFLTIFSFLLCGSLAAAPDDLHLRDAVSEALGGSPVVQRSESMASEAHWKKVEAYSGFLPSITFGAQYLTEKKYLFTDLPFGGANVSVPGIIPTTDYVLMAQLPLFDGFASTNHLRSRNRGEDAAQADFDWTKFRLQREVTLQFYRTLAARALREVAEQNLKTLNDHMRDVNLFKKAGVSTNYDVLRVEVQVSEAKSEDMNTNDDYEVSRAKLSEMLGRDHDERQVTGDLPNLEASLLDGKRLAVTDGRSDLKALESRAQASSLQASSDNRYWVPHVSLFTHYQYYNNLNDQFYDRDHFRDAYEVGIALNWNLFDGMTSIAHSRETIEERVQNEKTLHIARLKSTSDLEFWRRKFIYYATYYKARKSDIDKAQEAVRLAKEGNKAGTRTNTDLLDAETDLFRARAGSVNAQLGSIEALLNLELASGESLYDFK